MSNAKILYSKDDHLFILLNISEPGEENGIPSNQYLIINKGKGVLLDPGGFGVMPQVLHQLMRFISPDDIEAIVLSHQDPGIVGGLSSWMELTPAKIYVSKIWMRFLPHYGLKDMYRFSGVEDEGGELFLNNVALKLLPAHFLHSPGQLNVYDSVAKILFTGDIGAAEYQGEDLEQAFVKDFSLHQQRIEYFHQRYMSSNRALRYWLKTIAPYDIEIIAPQHGYLYKNHTKTELLNWLESLKCGADLLDID